MDPFLDTVTGLLFIAALLFLYIAVPLLMGYYLYKRKWISDRMRIFFSVSLFISGLGVAALVIAKLMAP